MEVEDSEQLDALIGGDLLALTTIEIPPRSRLYHLEPVGVGTPFVESLSSYFTRLAQAHNVSAVNLYKWEVAPLLQKIRTDHRRDSRNRSKLIERSLGPVNGPSDITAAWVQTLEALTKRSDLRLLTALSLGNAVSPEHLMKKTVAWCSSCYDEWHRSGQAVYDPLLWMFSIVEICPRHKQPLEQVCPHCKREQIFFSSRTSSGYCSRCYGSLYFNGENGRLMLKVVNKEAQNRQLWFAKSLGRWIKKAQNLESKPMKEDTIKKISSLIGKYTDGRSSRFSRLIGLEPSTTPQWLSGRAHIRLDSLLKICLLLNIDLTKFLTAEIDDEKHDIGQVSLLRSHI